MQAVTYVVCGLVILLSGICLLRSCRFEDFVLELIQSTRQDIRIFAHTGGGKEAGKGTWRQKERKKDRLTDSQAGR